MYFSGTYCRSSNNLDLVHNGRKVDCYIAKSVEPLCLKDFSAFKRGIW